ncbi:MAG: ATP synthase F1 subunit delta [Bacteroidia bacterium]|nr:ATP synthase F1 subunit delta [Bacteroidia bacterium]
MIVASRYAKSLIDLAVETKQLEEVANDMRLIKQVCKENREFVILLESPVVKTDKKMAIFHSVFAGKISATTSTFLDLIARKRREGYIDDIAYAFDEQYKTFKNITTAVVTTAVSLDAATKAKIVEIVKKNVTGEVQLIEKIDKTLIGGFILTVGDKQVDTTIKRKLNDLRKDFSINLYVPDLN